MKVTIMYRNNWFGGDGWTYYLINIEIMDTCPACGAKRGTPVQRSFCDDGEWYMVDTWINPCGHLDTYKNVYLESLHLQGLKVKTDFFR